MECYSDSTMNSDILKKNRTDLYPFRYKFANSTTRYSNLYVRVFSNQDIFVSGQMSKKLRNSMYYFIILIYLKFYAELFESIKTINFLCDYTFEVVSR